MKKKYTIGDYQNIVQKEADKYDIKINVIKYDASKEITSETIQRGIEEVKDYANSLKIVDVEDQRNDNSDLSAYSMIVSRTRTGSFYIENIYGSAYMKVALGVSIDLQNSAVVSVNSKSAYQSGAFVNFVSWQTTGITTTINSPSVGYVAATIQGRGTFSYADPVTGVTTGYTSSFTKRVNVNCK